MLINEIIDIDIHYIPGNLYKPGHYHYDLRFLFQHNTLAKLQLNKLEATKLKWFELHSVKDSFFFSFTRLMQKMAFFENDITW
jgi:hypothetical protein